MRVIISGNEVDTKDNEIWDAISRRLISFWKYAHAHNYVNL